MILSLILVFSINTAIAQSESYEECINAFQNDSANYAGCDQLKQASEECFQEIENAEQSCNAKFEEDKSICESMLNFECVDEIEDKISDCIKTLKSDQKRAECTTKQEKYDTCINSANEAFEKICRQQFPEQNEQSKNQSTCGNGILEEGEGCDDGNTMSGDGCDENCMSEETLPPSIPGIKTLPGPDAPTVGNVSPYLMSNFLPRVARTIISFAIGAAVLGLIISSIIMFTAYGNEEKYTNAKKGLYFSMIGLAISLLAFAIVQLVFFTGFQIGNIR